VTRSGSYNSTTAVVQARLLNGNGCDQTINLVTTSATTPGAPQDDPLTLLANEGPIGWATKAPQSAGYDPGMPYGTWRVCARTGSSSSYRYAPAQDITINDPQWGHGAAGPTWITLATVSGNPNCIVP
ncbi:MAG: hypothetical protein ACRDPR_11620, partial [Nocardioidaceae bacterium]